MEAVPKPADPVRSTYARRNPTPWNKDGATARENSPYRSHIAPLAGQNSPCSHKMAQFGRFYPCRENFIPLSPATSRAGRTLYRMRAGCGASKHNSTPGTAGVEGAGGPGCGARGRRRGLAGLRDNARSHTQQHGVAGVEGAGGTGGHGRASRSTTPSRRLACGDLAGGRARRRPEHQRRRKQQAQSRIPAAPPARTARGRAAAHGHTKQPGPTAGSDGARNTSGATRNTAQGRGPAGPRP